MHFQTFTAVVGTRACNAHCPFCISRQTGINVGAAPSVNWRNFHVACKLASKAGTTTVLLTGKGEPTLYPDQIEHYLNELREHDFPLIEMQTNGITIAEGKVTDEQLLKWYDKGLTTIALSVVHWNAELNKTIYRPARPEYPDLSKLIEKLHNIGFSVRICCMLLKGYIDSPSMVHTMINFCRQNKVEQLTFRNIVAATVTDNPEVTLWTREHALPVSEVENINQYIHDQGTLLHKLMHNTNIYDVGGQNVCMATCLTQDPDANDFRNLIFFPDGSLYWDWQYKGARIL